MHSLAVKAIVASVKLRQTQGDCPTEPPFTREQLEDTLVSLAGMYEKTGGQLLAAIGPKGDPGPQCPACGGYPETRFYGPK